MTETNEQPRQIQTYSTEKSRQEIERESQLTNKQQIVQEIGTEIDWFLTAVK